MAQAAPAFLPHGKEIPIIPLKWFLITSETASSCAIPAAIALHLGEVFHWLLQAQESLLHCMLPMVWLFVLLGIPEDGGYFTVTSLKPLS